MNTKKYYPIDVPDPIEAIKIRIEEMQLKQVDLVDEIGEKVLQYGRITQRCFGIFKFI